MKSFEFENIGKKMPYNVDELFFDQITEKTIAKAMEEKKSHRKKWLRWGSAVCAAVAVIVVVALTMLPTQKPETMDSFLAELSYEELDELVIMMDEMEEMYAEEEDEYYENEDIYMY